MRTFSCICGQTLFFENTRCVHCNRLVGWSEVDRAVVGVDGDPEDLAGDFIDPQGRPLRCCANRVNFSVCNRLLDAETTRSGDLCLACGMNRTVPDQSIEGNRERWAKLEAAKRRMLYDLSLIGWPMDTLNPDQGSAAPLRFEFKADAIPDDGRWVPMDDGQPVYTGHADGVITINLKEADDLERERMRLNLGEPQRSLVGHFRHEVGHYYWDLLFRSDPGAKQRFIDTFGDPDHPSYSEAMDRHYQQGPPRDWRNRFVSAYATMHPWEDWAETWSLFLDIFGTMDTLSAHGLERWPAAAADAGFDRLVEAYTTVAVALNELSRNRGMTALHPESVAAPVLEKLALVRREVRQREASTAATG